MTIFKQKLIVSKVILLLCVVASSLLNDAVAVCSTHVGKVVINEIYIPASNGSVGFLELKLLDPSVLTATSNFQNWKIDMYVGNFASKFGTDVSSGFSNSATNSCGQTSLWIRFPESVLSPLQNNNLPFKFSKWLINLSATSM